MYSGQGNVDSSIEVDTNCQAIQEQSSAACNELKRAGLEPIANKLEIAELCGRSRSIGNNGSALAKVIQGPLARMVGWLRQMKANRAKSPGNGVAPGR